jgi:hypothetical protein
MSQARNAESVTLIAVHVRHESQAGDADVLRRCRCVVSPWIRSMGHWRSSLGRELHTAI